MRRSGLGAQVVLEWEGAAEIGVEEAAPAEARRSRSLGETVTRADLPPKWMVAGWLGCSSGSRALKRTREVLGVSGPVGDELAEWKLELGEDWVGVLC